MILTWTQRHAARLVAHLAARVLPWSCRSQHDAWLSGQRDGLDAGWRAGYRVGLDEGWHSAQRAAGRDA